MCVCVYIYRERERERKREKSEVAKMFTIREFGGGGITVLFFQLIFRFEIFQNKKLVEERGENKYVLIVFKKFKSQ